jgi:hypothetical protein
MSANANANAYVIQLIGCNAGETPFDGQYLKEYDPDRPGIDPRGIPMLAHIVATPFKGEAMRFPDAISAWDYWKQTSRTYPIREYDGRPNRPLTAFTITVIPVGAGVGA